MLDSVDCTRDELDTTSTSDTHDGSIPSGRHANRVAKMRRRLLAAVRCHTGAMFSSGIAFDCVLVTLTYGEAEDRSRHITNFMKCARSWMKRRHCPTRYIWVRETSSNGRPHYHVLFWVPEGFRLPMPDSCGWWPHGTSKIELVRDVPAAVFYMLKGATKCAKHYRGRNLYRDGGLDDDWRRFACWLGLPEYARSALPEECDPHRAAGGGFVDRNTGELIRSPFIMVERRDGKGCEFVRLAQT